MRRFLSLGLLLATACTLLAAEQPTAVTAKTYVGKIAAGPGGAMIAVVIEGQDFLAYLCSNDETFNETHARWFRGKVEGQGSLEADGGGAKLVGKLTTGKIEGTVTGPDNKAHAFTAIVSGSAGLFRAEAVVGKDHFIAGWVRNDDGTTVGAAAKVKGKVATLQAPKVSPKGPPVGIVGQGTTLTGTQVDDLGLPLPGQILKVTLVSIDAKKNQFTVRTIDGKNITLPGNNLFSTDEKGKRSREDLGNPTPFFKIGGFFHASRKCESKTINDTKTMSSTTTKECTFDIGFGVQ